MTSSQQILSQEHESMLRDGSSIAPQIIEARGYRTITDANELKALGFAPRQCRAPGLLIPLHTTDGRNDHYVYRPDNPRVTEVKGKGRQADGTYPNKVIKYELHKGESVRLDCPPPCQPMLKDPAIPLWLTEGQKKADALASRGVCAVALLGVWNFKGHNVFGGTTFLNDFDYIALDGRHVRIVFDSDVMTKPQVRQALDRLTEHLQRKGAHVAAVYLPNRRDGTKCGVDDFFVDGHTIAELEAMIDAPRPIPQPAQPNIELLDEAPPILQRPLALIVGKAYAATWLPFKETVTETTDKQGNIVPLKPPQVKHKRHLVIVRDDGVAFSDVRASGYKPLNELGLEIKLPEIPPPDKQWSSIGVRAYMSGYRPDPVEVFERVKAVVNQFIDFDRSLAGQDEMVELIACYILATWFLDAFTVIGFLWPNGDRGSGKTQLLTVICSLAYLGQVILSGGSFASLRDMADYGACLAFDDAEGLADPRKTDPDKRTLLLAGNRKGNTVSMKEPDGQKGWKTRYVNTYCPRLFSATELPDPILASRTIVVPLIRTPDRGRANADPLDEKKWPCNQRALINDLWALSVAHLQELPAFEAQVNEHSALIGRNLEPWRAILAIALWLDDRGVQGLAKRMETLAQSYQTARADLEPSDLTALTIRAAIDCAVSAVRAESAVSWDGMRSVKLPTKAVTERAIAIAMESELDVNPTSITPKTIGKVMRRLGFNLERTAKRKERRVPLTALAKLATSYGIQVPTELSPTTPAGDNPPLTHGTNGSNSTNGMDDLREILI